MDLGMDQDIRMDLDLDMDMDMEMDMDQDIRMDLDLDMEMGMDQDIRMDLDLDMGMGVEMGLGLVVVVDNFTKKEIHMSMLYVVNQQSFLNPEAADKAAFVDAMTKKIDRDGYKFQDLMYEVYVCQKQIANIKKALVESTLFDLGDDLERSPSISDAGKCLAEMLEEIANEIKKECDDDCVKQDSMSDRGRSKKAGKSKKASDA